MAEIYKFFNAVETSPGVFDREYQESDFADYFGSVLSTGLLHTDNTPGMSVSVETGTLNTIVNPGKAIMKGHLYENTLPLTLVHSIPEASLNRIDRIVLRIDSRNQSRFIKLFVKEGDPSSTPVAPLLQRDNFIHEISLAQILVRANTVQLLQSDLIDERLDEDLGGLVYSLISIPTSQFQAEWDAFMAGIVDSGFATVASVDAVVDDLTTHKAEDAIDAHNASNISTTSGSDVQTEINSLKSSGNDGKNLLETTIISREGLVSKAGSVATFNELNGGILSIPDGLQITKFIPVPVIFASGETSKTLTLPSSFSITKTLAILSSTDNSNSDTRGSGTFVTRQANGNFTVRRSPTPTYANNIFTVTIFLLEFEGIQEIRNLGANIIFSTTGMVTGTANFNSLDFDATKAIIYTTHDHDSGAWHYIETITQTVNSISVSVRRNQSSGTGAFYLAAQVIIM